jgi:hypothetical protein
VALPKEAPSADGGVSVVNVPTAELSVTTLAVALSPVVRAVPVPSRV